MIPIRIAILFHKNDNSHTINGSLISVLSEYWRQDGHEVFYLFGTDQFKTADLLFVHVDLTIVPDSYLEFADQYPIVINGKVKDIRKSTLNQELLDPNDGWNGPVFVKSDMNSAGVPERTRNGLIGRVQKRLRRSMNQLGIDSFTPFFSSSFDYKIFDHIDEVPSMYFHQPGIIIQKFLPEIDKGKYCIRTISFLGDHMTPKRLKGDHPIVKGDTVTEMEYDIEPHGEIVQKIHELQFDYGKFDYVVVDGKPILLDINKTVGLSTHLETNYNMEDTHRYQAKGLYQFL